MDEILLHISQRLEALQVFIYSSLQNSRVYLQSYSEQANALSTRSRDLLRSCFQHVHGFALNSRGVLSSYANTAWSRVGPYFVNAQERLLLFIQWLRELCLQAWEIVRQQTASLRQHTFNLQQAVRAQGTEVSRGELQTGALGFVLGCAAGLLLGLSWPRRTLPPAVLIKAVVASNFSGTDGVILAEEVGSPALLRSDEVLVEVVAASVDPVDVALASGYARSLRRDMGERSGAPLVLGRDCSGVVIETGHSVRWLSRGDPVWLALPPWRSGAMAQLVVARECQVAAKPASLGFEAAASLPYAGLQAWRAVQQANLGPDTAVGKRVLVRDAGSGVGCVLVQLARVWGAQVTAVVSARAREAARQMGATEVLTASVDLEMELRSRPRFDVVFNTVGPSLMGACRRACSAEGQVVCTAPPGIPADSYGLLLTSVHTLWVKAKCLLKGPSLVVREWGWSQEARSDLELLRTLVEQGRLQPVTDCVFSAGDAELAFQHAASPNAVGKTVLHFRALDHGRCNYGA